jgi:hypothetical protein
MISSPTTCLHAGELSRPYRPVVFTHRAEGWPRAALLLAVVIGVQFLVFGLSRIIRHR